MHDRVRQGGSHCLADGHRVQSVRRHAVRAQLLPAMLGRARRRGRHLVDTSHELRHQPPPQRRMTGHRLDIGLAGAAAGGP
ncbi:hypothetical protein [Streptomyces sp. Ncost-T10-10d]|uniref:hypothetical protein n=1 Tax=Streptomyces sp. Ncost-T10-10d TaxID=1839774 RepID=UPI00159F1C47|nr:hypothetical protein [Streptomyces sp. Ncost-T10-10d]